MKPSTLVIALMGVGSIVPSPAQAADCNQLFVYAVQQFCSIAPNGQSLCQPIGLVGPAPTCALPGTTPTLTPMVLSPSALPSPSYNPFLPGARAANPYLANPGVTPPPFLPQQPFPPPPRRLHRPRPGLPPRPPPWPRRSPLLP